MYVIDNNQMYPEDHDDFVIFSMEKVADTEFESIVENAFQLCDWTFPEDLGKKIVEIDPRFFIHEIASCAYVGTEESDYEIKIRGFHHK